MENVLGQNKKMTELEWTICGLQQDIESATEVIQTEQQSLPKFHVQYSMPFEVQCLVRTGVLKRRETSVPMKFKLIAVPVQLAYQEGKKS